MIFIEQQFYGSKGTLGYIELFGDLSHGPFCPVLEEPWHLSYPQVFRSNRHGSDEWYMVPESADCGQIRLYRAVSFPDRWEFVRELLPGAIAVDSTLFEHQGLWWLFTSQKTENTGFNSSLYAYSASVFDTDQWTPHRQNPVVTGLDNARMAGRVFRNGRGELIRPAQSCVREYGESLSLNRITVITSYSIHYTKLYEGHYQPKIPADLGFYDLRVPESRIAQANLAKEYGISAFCYWHYWFGHGKRLLERRNNFV